MLIDCGLESEVQKVLNAKMVWPFPSKADGLDGMEQRSAIAKINKFKQWKDKSRWLITDRNNIPLV